MRKLVICLSAVLLLVSASWAEDLNWLTDLGKAQAKAKADKKLILMDFNGSDWCPACKILKKSVFSTPEFQKFASQNLVLVDIDFPRTKELPAEQKKANEKLAEKYGVEGLPTVVVVGSDGKQLDKKVGYEGESAKEYVAALEKLKTKP